MSVWAAAFAPGETFDFSALDRLAFAPGILRNRS
jgi:hypothetical protein